MKKMMALMLMFLLPLGVMADEREKRELLSSHETVAEFAGLKKQKCRHLTSLCPDHCGHGGMVATFRIMQYLSYKKPGEYGDPKAKEFRVKIDGRDGKLLAPEVLKLIKSLKVGEKVKLSWNHDYVTKGGSSYPVRPIVLLEKELEK